MTSPENLGQQFNEDTFSKITKPHFMVIPYDNKGSEENSFARLFDDREDLTPTPDKGYSKIVESGQRKHVLVWHRGLKLPFYLSSGLSPKEHMPAATWYPHFGVGEDGWINKYKVQALDNHPLQNFYGSQHLKDVSDWLGRNVGDIRDLGNVPRVNAVHLHAPEINSSVNPVSNTSENSEKGSENVLATRNAWFNPRPPTQEERIRDSALHSLLKQHATEHPELNLGIELP